ncbi:hypothetical protein D3C72_1813540 [compost metagenome]
MPVKYSWFTTEQFIKPGHLVAVAVGQHRPPSDLFMVCRHHCSTQTMCYQLRTQADAQHLFAGTDTFLYQYFLLAQPAVFVLLIHIHGTAENDEGINCSSIRQDMVCFIKPGSGEIVVMIL